MLHTCTYIQKIVYMYIPDTIMYISASSHKHITVCLFILQYSHKAAQHLAFIAHGLVAGIYNNMCYKCTLDSMKLLLQCLQASHCGIVLCPIV